MGTAAFAQELEPRTYSPNPIGSHFVVLSAVDSTGGVSVDPSLPIENVDGKINAFVAGYGQTFGLFGRSASVALAVPYVAVEVTGDVGEVTQRVTRYGFGDTRLRFAIGLLGSPALTPREFATRTRGPAMGASLSVVAPTGEYFPDKLINIGGNRWSLKPEIGITWPIGGWYLELTGGIWLFTDNDDFFGGVVREQDPLSTYQANVSYTFRPRLWLAAGWTYYTGGRTTVDSVRKSDWQANNRYGVTLSLPLSGQQSLKFGWSKGAATRIGSDFTTYSLTWQFAWF
ncbi:MAG TPA: transporter [Steroidobacteraceae bacterium]|nr:transporter [Steroidobacteraceae bacterium]